MAVGCRFYQHPSTLFYLHHFHLHVLVESQKPIMIYFYSLGNNGEDLTVLLLSCLPNALSLNAGLPILGKFITVLPLMFHESWVLALNICHPLGYVFGDLRLQNVLFDQERKVEP